MANAVLKLQPAKKIEARLFTPKVQMFMGQEAAKLMAPYVPMETGMLFKNYVVTQGKIIYQQPYARRQFYGDKFNFNKELHPLATAHWEKAMMRARGDDLARSVHNFIKSGRG